MICSLCRGAGNLFRVWYGVYQWRTCPVCRGRGTLHAKENSREVLLVRH